MYYEDDAIEHCVVLDTVSIFCFTKNTYHTNKYSKNSKGNTLTLHYMIFINYYMNKNYIYNGKSNEVEQRGG